MAGHSKWANIKHKKRKQDEKRGAVFTKLIRELTVAAREGGEDLSCNGRLRLAIDKAQAENMPKDKIQAAIDRGAGNVEGVVLEAIRYEGYGPAGVAFMVDCLTDNRNRTVAEVRHAFSKAGGNLGTEGSVRYLFERQGMIVVDPAVAEDALLAVVLEAGATDMLATEEGFEVETTREEFEAVCQALAQAALPVLEAVIAWVPASMIEVSATDAEKVLTLFERLDQLDDVQEVVHNGNIAAEVMQHWLTS
jgi:YebC/PmpR family DNA-binding regulatory protein